MKLLMGVLRELARLFVDDGAFALQIIAVVILAATMVLATDIPWAAGGILEIGCLVVLLANVVRSSRGDA